MILKDWYISRLFWISFGGKGRKGQKEWLSRCEVRQRVARRGSAKSWPLCWSSAAAVWPLDHAEAAGGWYSTCSPAAMLVARNRRLPGLNWRVWVYNQQPRHPQSVLLSTQPRTNYLQTCGTLPPPPPSLPLLFNLFLLQTHHLLQLLSVHHLLQHPPRVLVLRWVTPRVIPSPGVIHLNNRMTINETPIFCLHFYIFTNFHDHYHHIELESSFAKGMWLDKFSEWHFTQLTGWIGFTWVWKIFKKQDNFWENLKKPFVCGGLCLVVTGQAVSHQVEFITHTPANIYRLLPFLWKPRRSPWWQSLFGCQPLVACLSTWLDSDTHHRGRFIITFHNTLDPLFYEDSVLISRNLSCGLLLLPISQP